MKCQLFFFILSLLFSSNIFAVSDDKKSLEDTYLAQWFSIDSKQYGNIEISSISHSKYDLHTLRYVSDDGDNVYGSMAYPSKLSKTTSNTNKVALLMHPMGSDREFWWNKKHSMKANTLTDKLLALGYTVISLDARVHGQRKIDRLDAKSLIAMARSVEPRLYNETIIGSVRDYRYLLTWIESTFQPKEVIALGYSMGAQMSLLLASYEPSISAVLAMVPPYVQTEISPVAPRVHVDRINNTNILWLAGKNDPYSSQRQTESAFNLISSKKKSLQWFDSGHRLPLDYLKIAKRFLASLQNKES